MTTKKDCGDLKKWFSKRDDNFRKPYEAETKTYLRSHIYVATCNEDAFLTDPTGDRRYWVIPINKVIDIAAVRKHRDAIWATAYEHFINGAAWWFDHVKEDLVINLNARYRITDDVWTEILDDWLTVNNYSRTTSRELLTLGLGLPEAQIDRRAETRVSKIMKQIGWSYDRYYVIGENGKRKRVRGFIKPDINMGHWDTSFGDVSHEVSHTQNHTEQSFQDNGTLGTHLFTKLTQENKSELNRENNEVDPEGKNIDQLPTSVQNENENEKNNKLEKLEKRCVPCVPRIENFTGTNFDSGTLVSQDVSHKKDVSHNYQIGDRLEFKRNPDTQQEVGEITEFLDKHGYFCEVLTKNKEKLALTLAQIKCRQGFE
jgi:predicted P-loop ATPase